MWVPTEEASVQMKFVIEKISPSFSLWQDLIILYSGKEKLFGKES